jgi:broad specificity phosphatase PhoE
MTEQAIYVIRHGARYDQECPAWKETAKRPHDPSLSALGFKQATETGESLYEDFTNNSYTSVTTLASPFLRTIQTANNILDAIESNDADGTFSSPSQEEGRGSTLTGAAATTTTTLRIRCEDAIWEIDHDDKLKHDELPHISERAHYFPRIDTTSNHLQILRPNLPENFPDQCLERCKKAAEAITAHFPYQAGQAIIIISHAAPCVAIAACLCEMPLKVINPVGPANVTKMVRKSDDEPWVLVDGWNCKSDHTKVKSKHTVPWHNWGENWAYSGPDGLTGESK